MGLRHSIHAGSTAEAVCEMEDVTVTPRCERHTLKIVDADEDAGAVG